jgi:hypothetical protein
VQVRRLQFVRGRAGARVSLDRVLRRLGVHKRHPARRRMLALALQPVCSEAQIERLARYAVECGTIEAAVEQLTAWLESGDWRARWAEADAADRAKEAGKWPHERVRGHAWARLCDGASIEQVAGELGITASEVRELAVEHAAAHSVPDRTLQEALGVRPERPWPPWQSVEQQARDRAAYERAHVELAGVAADEPPPPPTARSEAEIRAHYLNLGRRAPAHVIETLTRQPATRSNATPLPQKDSRR